MGLYPLGEVSDSGAYILEDQAHGLPELQHVGHIPGIVCGHTVMGIGRVAMDLFHQAGDRVAVLQGGDTGSLQIKIRDADGCQLCGFSPGYQPQFFLCVQ